MIVVDTMKVLSPEQCFFISEPNTITQLSSTCKLSFTTDRLISRFSHVQHTAQLVATEFLTKPKSHRIIVNIVDPNYTNNIGGFNISNFRMRYLADFVADVIADYEQSILGAVIKEIMNTS